MFPPKLEQECAEPFRVVTGDDSSHSQGQSRKRLLLAFRGHPIRSLTHQGTSIGPTYWPHMLDMAKMVWFFQNPRTIRLLKKDYPAGNDFMQVWTNLCYRECFCKTSCWQELHFEFSRQNLNRNVQSPSM